MSEQFPSRKEALQFLRQTGCSKNVVRHCETVSKLAVEIAKVCQKKGLNVNLELVEVGALLHDIGRSRTHSVDHGIVGARILRSLNLPESIVSIVKRHIGGGISMREAGKLGWPDDVYVPQTLEEKIVAYSDKLVEGTRRVPIENTIKAFEKKAPPAAIARIWKLHEEMTALIGDSKCLL